MFDTKPEFTRSEIECLEMFRLFEIGAFPLMMKANIKKWEYCLYGGVRPELYPQDKKALFTMVQFKNARIQKDRKKDDTRARIKDKMHGTKGGS